jgi:hypothetical protein
MSDNVYRQQLEKLGEDVVRHRLANRMAIGDRPENNPSYEFVHILNSPARGVSTLRHPQTNAAMAKPVRWSARKLHACGGATAT